MSAVSTLPWIDSLSQLQKVEKNLILSRDYLMQLIEFSKDMASLLAFNKTPQTSAANNNRVLITAIYQRVLSASPRIKIAWAATHKQDIDSVVIQARTYLDESITTTFTQMLARIEIDVRPLDMKLSVPNEVYESLAHLLSIHSERIAFIYLCERLISLTRSIDRTAFGKEMEDSVPFIIVIFGLFSQFFEKFFPWLQQTCKFNEVSGDLVQCLFSPLLNCVLEKVEIGFNGYINDMIGMLPINLLEMNPEVRAQLNFPLSRLDQLCADLAKICHSYNSFCFLLSYFGVEESMTVCNSDFGRLMKASYALLESRYMELSFVKAHEIQQLVETNGWPVYSSVEDYTFLLLKTMRRSAFSLDSSSWCELHHQVASTLLPTFAGTFASTELTSHTGLLRKLNYQCNLNSLSSWMEALRLDVLPVLQELYSAISKRPFSLEIEIHSENQNNDIKPPIDPTFKQMHLAYENLIIYFANIVKTKALLWFDGYYEDHLSQVLARLFHRDFSQYSQISSAAFTTRTAKTLSDEFCAATKEVIDSHIKQLKIGWNNGNFFVLAQAFYNLLAKSWEKAIKKSRFTLDGGFLLFEETHTVTGYLAKCLPSSSFDPRVAFVRLSIIARILSLEKASDFGTLTSIFSSAGLSIKEAHAILALRSDIS